MIKRTSRNFKVPLVYGGQWKDHQTFQKWDPIAKRLITVNCCLPGKPLPPEPVCAPPSSVSLSISGNDLVIVFPDGVFMSNYDGYLVNVTDNIDVALVVGNVNVGGTYTVPNGASGLTPGKQYRIRLECTGLGDPACDFVVYSNTITAPAINYQFVRVSAGVGVNPGSGNFSTNVTTPPNVVVNFNKTDTNSVDASTFLSTIAGTATTITITKNPSNFSIFTINSSTDAGTYWSFACTISSFLGIVNVGDTVTLTYA